MKIDLHTHSYFSDGTHSPQFVIERARRNGVSHLALTDHDCLEGFLATEYIDLPETLHIVSGVEISSLWENQEIHVLGLCLDPRHKGLTELLKSQQQRRQARLEEIDRKLVKAGIRGLVHHMRDQPCCSPGRAHVARFLTEKTALGTRKKAFRTLAKNGRFYVRPDWCSMNEAVHRIREAGGIAVLAHPHRYPLSKSGVRRLLEDFRSAGGEALEICCSNMTRDSVGRLAQHCQEFEFWASAGSDFHSSEAHWMDIGKIPPLPEQAKKNAIWLHPKWHFPIKEPD